MKSKDLYPAIFSRHAAAYQQRLDGLMRRGEAAGRQRVLELLGVSPGMRVLDLACGPGTLTRYLAAAASPNGEVVGVDLAEGMIELARAAGLANARFEVMDIEHLAFAGASFDAAACGHGLQFVSGLVGALAEVRRVLRANARYAASVPVGAPSQGVQDLLDPVIDKYLPPPPRAVDQEATRSTIADVTAFRDAALEGGFNSARVEVIKETVRWESAAQLVGLFASWWDCAARLERLDATTRQTFLSEAVMTLEREHPGAIETVSRSHVLFAIA